MYRASYPILAALALLTAAGAARAGFADWSYQWSGVPFSVPANGGTREGAINLLAPGQVPALGPVAPIRLRDFTAVVNGADRYFNAPYSLKFTLSDPDERLSHTLTLRGEFNGTVTSRWTSLRNTFVGGSGVQSFDFLGHDFTVTFGFRGPSAPTQTWTGDITASVAVSAFPSAVVRPALAPTPVGAPEPDALVLAGLALPAVGLAARRLRGRG